MKHSVMLCVQNDGCYVPVTSPFECEDFVFNSLLENSKFIVVELPKIAGK